MGWVGRDAEMEVELSQLSCLSLNPQRNGIKTKETLGVAGREVGEASIYSEQSRTNRFNKRIN